MQNKGLALTQERVRTLITYDPETGLFAWRLKRRGPQLSLQPGCISKNGYRVITLDYKHHYAQRIAWLYLYGAFPAGDIDHINGERSDNRIANLRAVTRGENMQNTRRARKDNKSCGLQGVTWDKQQNSWKARIHKDGKQIGLGHHATAEAAHTVYLVAKARLHIRAAL